MGDQWAIDLAELENRASKFWPASIIETAANTNVVPVLLDTQSEFISILTLSKTPTQWLEILRAAQGAMCENLFLKHLQVLSDVGGEKLQRISRECNELFPEPYMPFVWRGKEYVFEIPEIHGGASLSNAKLKIDGKGLAVNTDMDDVSVEVAMVLLHGASSLPPVSLPDSFVDGMIVGTMLGNPDELQDFITKRYIQVSRVTSGATANAQGQALQQYVCKFLAERLGSKYKVLSNGSVPGVTQNDRTDINFDIVVENNGFFVAIEISFQQTTNSTIERKGGQAASRQQLLHAANARIAYVIDGVGNFHRKAAMQSICDHSDCTVAFTDDELNRLADFIESGCDASPV